MSAMEQRGTTLASALRPHARLLEDRGEDVAAWLDRAGLDPAQIADPRARVPQAAVAELLNQLLERYPGENIGFTLRQYHRVSDWHLISLICACSETGLDALRRLVRYQSLVSTAAPLSITVESDAVTVSKSSVQPLLVDAVNDAYVFAAVVNDLQRYVSVDMHPRQVRLAGPPLGDPEAYRTLLCRDVRFDAGASCLVYSPEQLAAPLTTANREILQANELVLKSLVNALRATDYSARVRLHVLDALPERVLAEREAADLLKVGQRTLQRRLREEGVTFREVVDDTRRRLAEGLMDEGVLSIAEVSYACGFEENSSFSRAFKRWTGHPPSAHADYQVK